MASPGTDKIAGCEILARISENTNSLVFRGWSARDNRSVILKVLNREYPTPEELSQYKREYEIVRSLDCDGVITTYGLEKHGNTLAILFEDFRGVSLDLLAADNHLDLHEVLDIGIRVVEGLREIHDANVIHKDINPSNIVFYPETRELKIIDFGIASVATRENPVITAPKVLEGTLTYISPEQTGRMNRAIDYRTDFYSLGATFYQLITGRPPFQTDDPIELLHCHIAREPIPLHELDGNIPKVVSDIVMKLLAKTPEERYQSAWGIWVDLEECWNRLFEAREISPFPLARSDVHSRLQVPKKLYGREREIVTLLAAYERVSQGDTELMLVSGYSGVGKSALVCEFGKEIAQQDGNFIFGKFDQFQQSIPYSAIVKAFRQLVGLLLTESEPRLNKWREELSAALGPNGRLVTDIIPEVEHVVGSQPALTDPSPAEAQNRFNLVFQDFVQVFSKPEHPLVLFLDDMQWADTASLRLIQLLAGSSDIRYFLIVGAYRENEVEASHPLTAILNSIRNQGTSVSRLDLRPLELSQIHDFLADSLKCDAERVLSLAQHVFAKTHGNPFFMIEFLKSLYADKLLEFVPPPALLEDGQHLAGSWQWSTERIQSLAICDNVVELIVNQIRKLESETQFALELAAFIGNQFDLETLATVYGKTPRETAKILRTAVKEGMIFPVGNASRFIESEVEEPAEWAAVECKFSHDRIQQALYSLVPPFERAAIHHRVGRRILQNAGPECREKKVFDIVNQLNLGVEIITVQNEKIDLAELNLAAGMRAKAAAAYVQSLKYLKLGIYLLQPGGWLNNYSLMLALHVAAVEAAYLNTDFDDMERLARIIQEEARTPLDKMAVYEIRVQSCIGQYKLLEAVEIAIEGLALLGIRFTKKPNRFQLFWGLLRSKIALLRHRFDKLVDLPEMTDAHKLAAMRLLSVASGAYFGAPELYILLMFKMAELSAKYGNASVSSFAYASYGSILCGAVGDIKSGRRLGELALRLMDKINENDHKARTIFILNCLVTHWHSDIKLSLSPLQEAYRIGLETGDFEFAYLAALIYCVHAFYAGKHLRDLERVMAAYSRAMSNFKQETARNLNEICRQVILNLMGESENPKEIIGEGYNEREMLPIHLKANDQTTLFTLYFDKLMLCYLFNDFKAARAHIVAAQQYISGATSTYMIPQFFFYRSLTGLAAIADVEPRELKSILRKVASAQRKMKKWAEFAPMNHLHKFYLVEAERHRVLGREKEAEEAYDHALRLAHAHEFIAEEALTNYLAARFYLARGKLHLARAHMLDARYAYLRWGATAKVREIDCDYGTLLSGVGKPSLRDEEVARATPIASGYDLDLTSVLKASQAISGEIVLDRLLEKLMQIVIENAGAGKGFLILGDHASGLRVEAQASLETGNGECQMPVPLDRCPQLSPAIVHYVYRTKTSVVLCDATTDSLFALDGYVRRERPKSILCLPIMRHGNLTGILYLENNLISGAFSPGRVQVLELIASQAAISIEHAKLYAELEESHTRRKFLSKKIIDLLEADRKKIAMELHDGIGQILTTLKMDLEWVSSHSIGVDSALEPRLGTAMEKAVQVIKGVREISYGLRPSMLDNLGLLPSIQNLINDIGRSTKVHIHFFTRNVPKRFGSDVETAIYRVIQEALNNVLKHSKAKHVHISFVKRGGLLLLSIEDDGVGFQPELAGFNRDGKESMGVLIMNERIVQVNGEFSIESRIGGGTLILAEIPL